MMRTIAWIAGVCLLAGCATTQYTPTTRYRLDPVVDIKAGTPGEGSLGIRALIAARPYKQAIVSQDAGYVLSYSSHEEWSELPSATITRTLTDALAATKRFKDVGDAVNLAAPDYILTGELRKFDLDRAESAWSAVCEVRLELRKGMTREPVWAETLTASEPLPKNEVTALPAAMSRAVGKVVTQAATAIAGQK
jgi:ABC-type uncharacterized transport system auxiliary subunit